MFGGYVKKLYLCTRNRERCGSDWNTESEVRFFQPLKKNFLKKSSKKFGGYKQSPYLCIRFLKESHKEEFFERFRYEQASSTRLTLSK